MRFWSIWVLCLCPIIVFCQNPYPGNYSVYYGNLHSHTGCSDGQMTPSDAFVYARDSAHIDFLAVTDHLDQVSGSEWANTLNFADALTSNGSFVAIAGYEWSSPYYGHCNVFNTTSKISSIGWYYSDWSGFRNWLNTHQSAFAQFNHPGDEIYFNNWYDFEYKGAKTDSSFPLIEFQNIQQATNWYELALNKGWHLTPVWNQDNHSADWGNKNDGRVGIWADTLTRAALFDAIRHGRTFASMDKNASVWLDYNWLPMGSRNTRGMNGHVRVLLQDLDNEAWSAIELVTNNGIAATFSSQGNIDTVVTIHPFTDNYVFIRGIQVDGDYVWSGPVYIEGVLTGMDVTEYNALSIYPNPVTDFTNIKLSQAKESANVNIYDVNGRVIWSKEAIFSKNNELRINLQFLETGMYILECKTDGTVIRSRIMKK